MRLLWLLALLLLTGGGFAPAPPKATVYVFLASDCPIAGRYGPRLQRIGEVYSLKGVRFVAVFPNPREAEPTVRAWLADRGLEWSMQRDRALAQRLGATYSPEVVVVDATETVRYRGAIDDNDNPERVRLKYLPLALDAVLAGKPVARPRTKAVGCQLDLTSPAPTVTGPTYAKEVAPILNRHCVECHRAGEMGPMPLDRFATAHGLAAKIREVTQNRRMPPWDAETTGVFHDERRLSASELATLAAWAAAGAPEGDPKAMPPVPTFPARDQWKLGTPDAIVTLPEPYPVPAEGRDLYRCFVLSNPFDEDRWIAGIEFQPGARAVVHHASVFADRTGQGRRLDNAQPGLGYTNPTPGNGPGFTGAVSGLGGWAPGHQPRRLPDGIGLRLPKGADLVLEVHYHLTGKPERDQTRFALYLAKGKVEKPFRVGDVGTDKFTIPAGAKDYTLTAARTLPGAITLYSVTPHLHQLGTKMEVTAELPSGELKPLIALHRWDFNNQPSYRFKTPLRLPQGTRIELVAHYDNSAENPNNPHSPPRPVSWGESTDAEMCTLFFGFTIDDERLRSP